MVETCAHSPETILRKEKSKWARQKSKGEDREEMEALESQSCLGLQGESQVVLKLFVDKHSNGGQNHHQPQLNF